MRKLTEAQQEALRKLDYSAHEIRILAITRLSMMRIPEMENCKCPKCGHKLNAGFSVVDNIDEVMHPEIGDTTLCSYCGELLTLDTGYVLRPATDAEFTKLPMEFRALIASMSARIKDTRSQDDNNRTGR